jgi:ATP-dependent DNA helicase PIF1
MMSLKLFEILDAVAKTCRKNYRPFGGIQVIFLGDFYQLPPVGSQDEPETMRFCFESGLWNLVFAAENYVKLLKIFRQKDEVYSKILNQVREGKMYKSSHDKLVECVNKPIPTDMIIVPTKLFPKKIQVEMINQQEMQRLGFDLEKHEYKLKFAYDMPLMNPMDKMMRSKMTMEQINTELEYMANNTMCEKTVFLKKGAQVMCIKNIAVSDQGICNGSQGIVTGFTKSTKSNCDDTFFPIVKFNNGIEMVITYEDWPSETIPGIGIRQIPLILAWAITIHKSQGCTMDAAEIDVGSNIFECGQTYVALSRVKSLEGLYLSSFDYNKIKIHKKVRDFYSSFEKLS